MRTMQKGFTLIELMIVLAILAIITTIAVSTYSSSTTDSERVRIMAELTALNDAMARYYQGNYSYDGATEEILRGANGGTKIEASPSYDVTVTPDGQSYTIVAAPVPGGTMDGEENATYSINEKGQRCISEIPADGCTSW